MKVMVDLPIPDGWELAEEKMRVPNNGDWFMYADGGAVFKRDACCPWNDACWIVRKKWTWPEWLNAGRLTWCDGINLWRFDNACHSVYLYDGQNGVLNWTPPPDKTKVYKSSEYK